MNFEDIIQKKDLSVKANIIRACLIPFSLIYNFAHILFFIPYKLGLRKKFKFHLPVICVGNITMGGTGKTPFVITLTNILKELGYKPVIISRGYGRKNTEIKNLVFSPKTELSAKDTGDEPQLLSQALNVPIIIGKNRIESLKLLNNTYGNIVILDDGMQYWQLEKDIEIGIASNERPFGSELTIPAGDLREPKSGLKRCKFIVLISNNKAENNTEKVQSFCPNSKVYFGYTKPLNVIFEEKEYSVDFLKNKTIFAFSGIGNPTRFFNTLKDLGAIVSDYLIFPDHHNYTENDILKIKEKAKNCDLIITTAKDGVKLPKDFPVAILNIYTFINENFKTELQEEINKIEK